MGNTTASDLKYATSCGSATTACGNVQCDPLAEDATLDMLEYRNATMAPTPSTSSTVCCMKASVGSMRAPRTMDGHLRRYFLGPYRDGAEPEEIRGYVLERIDTGTFVWVHGGSSISVWSEVVNIASESTPLEELQLLFHYCSRAAFTHVTNENRKDAELFASLVEPDGPYGYGVYASVYEPAAFGGRKVVLDNMFKAELESSRQMPHNHLAERVSFCIPIIAPANMCYEVRNRSTPEMVYGSGRDKTGSDLDPGRDLWVIRIKDEGKCAHHAAASYEGVLRRRLVRHEGVGARERAVQDIVSLGRHLRRRGRHQEALMAFEKALQLNLTIHGDSHPSVATSYNEMAVVYHRHCQYAQALEYYERTLQIQLATLGPTHPHVASTYNNMAVVYGRQGDHAKALEYYQKAHEIKLETLGDGHPSVAATFHNMANIYRRQNEYAKALEYYDKALQIRLASLGDTHPSVGDTYYNMGMLFRWMHKPGQAKYKGDALKSFRSAYKAYLETYGPENQETCDAKQQMMLEQAVPVGNAPGNAGALVGNTPPLSPVSQVPFSALPMAPPRDPNQASQSLSNQNGPIGAEIQPSWSGSPTSPQSGTKCFGRGEVGPTSPEGLDYHVPPPPVSPRRH